MTAQPDNSAADVTAAPDTAELRAAMVEKVAAWRAQLDLGLAEEVRAAMRAVPRHLFTPGCRWRRRTQTAPSA